MDLNIRKAVLKNLDNSSYDEIKDIILDSIKEGDEVTLPGLGVMFEVLWNSSNEDLRNNMVSTISSAVGKAT